MSDRQTYKSSLYEDNAGPHLHAVPLPAVHLIDAIVLLAFGLIAAILGLYFFTGFYMSDDMQYVGPLMMLSEGKNVASSIGGARWLISLPYALYALTTGLDAFWAVSWFTLLYIVSVIAGYLILQSLYDRVSAAVFVWLYATCPLILLYTGSLVPDMTLSQVVFAQSALAIYLLRSDERPRWALLSLGMLYSLGYTIKEFAVVSTIAAPVLLGLLALRDRKLPLREGLVIGAGVAVILMLDALICWALYGDPLVRLAAAAERDVVTHARDLMAEQGTEPLDRIAFSISAISGKWSLGGIFLVTSLLLPLLSALHGFRRGDFLILSLMTWWWVVTHLFMSVSLTEYVGVPLQPRYLAPATVLWVFSVVVAARIALGCAPSGARRPAAAAGLGIALVAGVMAVADAAPSAGEIYGSTIFREALRLQAALEDRERDARLVFDGPSRLGGVRLGRVTYYGVLRNAETIRRPVIKNVGERTVYYATMRANPSFSPAEIAASGDWEVSAEEDLSRQIRGWRTRWDGVVALLGRPDLARRDAASAIVVYRLRAREVASAGR